MAHLGRVLQPTSDGSPEWTRSIALDGHVADLDDLTPVQLAYLGRRHHLLHRHTHGPPPSFPNLDRQCATEVIDMNGNQETSPSSPEHLACMGEAFSPPSGHTVPKVGSRSCTRPHRPGITSTYWIFSGMDRTLLVYAGMICR